MARRSRLCFAALVCALTFVTISSRAGQADPLSAPKDQFRQNFLNPPAEARILKIIHSWPDEPDAQDRLIRSLANQNFGGVVCNVSFSNYLESEAKWAAFRRAVGEAKKAGFALWLYDEKGYPSATAGGLVLRGHPEWQARGLLIAETESQGGSISLQVPPGRLLTAAAFPVREGDIDLEHRAELAGSIRDGSLSWVAPAGSWRVMAITEDRLYDGTHASMSLAEHIPYPNLLDPAPTAAFLALTHQRYAEHIGRNLGNCFISTFTDEPSLMSLFLRRMPYRVLPWSAQLPLEFKKRRGYALEALIPALVCDAGAPGPKARYDYWQTVAELVSENFFGQIQQWCAKHAVLSGGHLLMEEDIANHAPLYGDFFRCLRRLDAPSIDCLTSIPDQVPWFVARLAASAAELEGRRVVMCETSDHSQRYRPPGDKRPAQMVSSQQIKGTCNRLIRSGVNTITSYYSFTELSNGQLRELNTWAGRCCAAVTGGRQVTDVAVVYPIESLWSRFTPSRHLSADCPAATHVQNIFRDVSESLYASARDFAYIDSRTLTEATVEQDTLVHGKLRWRVVILPGVDTLPLKASETLSQFAQNGGIVIAVGARPMNSEEEFPSGRVQSMSAGIFGNAEGFGAVCTNRAGGGGAYLPAGSTAVLPALLEGILDWDVRVEPQDSKADNNSLKYTHRRMADRELYFVINDSNEPWRGKIDLAAEGEGEQWDPATGHAQPLSAAKNIGLRLDSYGAAVFVFQSARLPAKRGLSQRVLPVTRLKPLARVQPIVARGEFVKEELVTNGTAWKVMATLTKSQVDTFLFLRFPYPGGIDLAPADSIVLETGVPANQSTPNQLLVMLHEKGGADYLASTGRLLGMQGRDETWVPVNRFQLAGWSKDANGKLDCSEIVEIRVGWGGYLGTEGEKVCFTLTLPLVGRAE